MNHPTRILLRTWSNMAIAALLMDALLGLAAATIGMKPTWYGMLLLWPIILSGPFSLLGFGEWDVLPVLGLSICLYGLSVAWFLWKPSLWSKWVFLGLSLLWLLF